MIETEIVLGSLETFLDGPAQAAPKQINRQKRAIPFPPAAATPPSSPAPTAQPYDEGQPAALKAALYNGQPADDTE
jgi:hypothetical protein